MTRKSDGLVLWKLGYTNLVSASIDTDGSIFNGVGYREGYRLSSSGSLSAQADTVVTGFIPCSASDVVRMGGVSWVPGEGADTWAYCYISFFDSGFSVLGSYNVAKAGSNTARGIVKSTSSVVTDGNGVSTFYIDFSDGSAVAYFRINGYGSGTDMIVTVNEEISG